MKSLKLSVPSNLNQLVGLTGIGLVVLATLGIHAFWPSWTLPVIGAFLGYSVIGDAKGFMISGLSLFAAKWGLGHLPILGNLVQNFAQNLIILVAPAMLVVAIRSLYNDLKG